MPKETSAGAVIFRRDNNEIYYLLLHYGAGHWDFPKGNIEKGEKEEEAVRREVKEETGIEDIEIIEGFKEWIKYFYRQNYKLSETRSLIAGQRPGLGKAPWVFKIVTYYLAETKTKEVRVSFEHQGYQWLPYQEALEKITYKNAKEILEKAHFFLTRIK